MKVEGGYDGVAGDVGFDGVDDEEGAEAVGTALSVSVSGGAGAVSPGNAKDEPRVVAVGEGSDWTCSSGILLVQEHKTRAAVTMQIRESRETFFMFVLLVCEDEDNEHC